jgi:K+-transporting ATPase ATPase C chain
MLKEIKPALLLFLVMLVITGVLYPIFVTGVARVVFPEKASGSLIEKDGIIVGSELIGQQFSKPEYFHPRPSNAGIGYDSLASGASNLAATSDKLKADIAARFEALSQENPGKKVPVDLLTSSASGLDPHISVEAANFQVQRIAKLRKLSEGEISKLVENNTEGRFLGIFGEQRVNVLKLNIALDSK